MNNIPLQNDKHTLESWIDLAYDNPGRAGKITLPVLSGSMAPELLPGDSIVIETAGVDDCRPGDIIVFRTGNKLTAHRLLLRMTLAGTTYVFQKGDGNRFGHWIPSSLIVGMVTEARSPSGRARSFMTGNDRELARKTARKHVLLDCAARLFYLPGKLVPSRLKQGMKAFLRIK